MKFKFYSLLIVITAFFTIVSAQPIIKDQGVMGGDDDDVFTCMYPTKDGGMIVGGYSDSDSSGQKTKSSKDNRDYWIVKLNRNKAIEWDKTIRSNGYDYLHAIQQTTDSGYILGGYTFGGIFQDKTENSRGKNDYWIVKLDSKGNIQWDKTLGGSDDDYFRALQQTSDGGYIVGGYSLSDISGEKTQSNRGYLDYWIVKLDARGHVQWDKTVGGDKGDFLDALQHTSDGGYLLGGTTYSDKSGDKTQINRGWYDYWVVKLDGKGNIQWDKTIGGDSYDYLSALRQTTDGGYIVGGYSASFRSGEKTSDSKGGYDFWIVKLDASGNKQWDRTIGGDYIDDLEALQQTSDGGYILAGYSQSDRSGDKTEDRQGRWTDYWVVKTDSRGKVQWDKTIGGSQSDEAHAVNEIKRNHYIIGGWSYSGISYDKTSPSRDSAGIYPDYWLVELRYVTRNNQAITQTQQPGKQREGLQNNTVFSVYPNPAKGVIHVQVVGTAIITITNADGKLMLTKKVTNNAAIHIFNFARGTYYVQNTTTGEVKKIVLQ